MVDRATAAAAELTTAEMIAGGEALVAKVRCHRPAYIAFLGITAYRAAFGRPDARVGLQPERLGDTRIWVLPNPSGLNAHYQVADLGRLFAELWTVSRATIASQP